MTGYTVLLFYKYVHIDNPEELRDIERERCERLNLKCRTIIAHEGINCTLEGTNENVEKYLSEFFSDPRFAGTHIKKSEGNGKNFPRISVKVRPEIVTLGLEKDKDIDPNKVTGKHLPPETLYEWLRSGKDISIVDMRNTYEHASGHFKGSVLPPLDNFRDLKDAVKTLEPLKEKTVVTVCTGGVRCEKASGYLVDQGFKDVYQLDGGIVSYMEKFKDNPDFRGSLYVFDDRVTMSFVDPSIRGIVGKCERCGAASENYTNCTYGECRRHYILCVDCSAGSVEVPCSSECAQKAADFIALRKEKAGVLKVEVPA